MLAAAPLLVTILAAAVAVAPPEPGPTLARWRAGEVLLHLEVAPGPERRAGELAVPARSAAEGASAPPSCVADVCQPRVEVPGLAISTRRPHRTELFASLIDRAGIEPFATIAWIFARTGLRVDWAPPERGTGDPARWGHLSVRVRLRLDAMNRPALFARDQERGGQRSWKAVIAPRA